MSLLKIQGLVSVLALDYSSSKALDEMINAVQGLQSHEDLHLLSKSYNSLQKITFDILLGYIHDDVDKMKSLFISDDVGHLAIAGLTAIIRSDTKPEAYLSELALLVTGRNVEYDQALRRIGHALGWGSVRKALTHIRTGNPLWDVSVISTYLSMWFKDNLEEAQQIADSQTPEIALMVHTMHAILDNDTATMTNDDTYDLALKIQELKAKT